MPLFEYHCLECHNVFERLRPAAQRDQPPACPTCGGERVKRTIAAFATMRVSGPSGADPQPVGGGGCACGGNCGCRA